MIRLGELWNSIIEGHTGLTEHEFLTHVLEEHMNSERRKLMLTARDYYKGKHDIASKVRKDASGKILLNIPNNKITDNVFDDLVDQKTNYLLSRQLDIDTENEALLDDIFTPSMHRKLKRIAEDAHLCGVGYLRPYVDDNGKLTFQRLLPENTIPLWRDIDHTELDGYLYFYEIDNYLLGGVKQTEIFVEFHTKDMAKYYKYEMNALIPLDEPKAQVDLHGRTWSRTPLIAFKANSVEQPLLVRVKALQDALNRLMSDFTDNMQQNVHNTVLILENYDGEDLEEFRQNLAMYGVVKIRTFGDSRGGLNKLDVEVNAANYELILKLLKKSIVKNGRGFDADDDRMGNNPNRMNIKSMYSDIDLDANAMELEFKAALEELLIFVSDYKGVKVDATFIFNRDIPINESEVIADCMNSAGIVSERTIVANHPWTKNIDEELAQKKSEAKEYEDYVENGLLDTEESKAQEKRI